ncbi:mandelate racemase [Ktedonobacter sp. SOSP1-52]|uniref:enolase C-terminal domain-like protein n=1 Tax=Ktedonobacter sp. SOSP1-52 TaxID=2778366 RepID=UPI00191657DE|nr:enolase C-terminal domain-like protein [Ktedonobacter sp. SOSP1-52]GHO72126.1 mandelate racemase [Ktedonobacter sp. SOSP1-52]
MTDLTIRNVRIILTMPDGANRLVIVKLETSEPGLYGLGCATFTQRHLVVRTAIEAYLKPFLIGKDPTRIEDLWQTMAVNAYWRNGPVLNNAISGVDMALWDIKAKLAGMPLYQLFGGKCREGAAAYGHADGHDEVEVADNAQALIAKGYRYIRCQAGGYGGKAPVRHSPEKSQPGIYYDSATYARSIPRLFAYLREHCGDEVELMHDIHERLAPGDAIRVAKQLEPYRLFFLEDPLPPEQLEWLHMLRQQSATPIAMGELFNNPQEWVSLISRRLIDFIRVHISQIGGLTAARKLAILAETFGVRTAWHGPGDTSPVGHAANLHLDVSSHNFGIQECGGFPEAVREVFPGCPEVRGGYLYPNERPGLGIDIDERLAAKYPCDDKPYAGIPIRLPDGTATYP